MDLKIGPIILSGSNYAVWAPDMETLLKSKGLWKYKKIVIPYPTDDREKFFIDGKKHEAIRVITAYILQEVHFHISGIDCPHQFWKNLNSLFDRFDERHIVQMEKELISIEPYYFDIIKDYLAHVKEL
jgi:hypothetical protein